MKISTKGRYSLRLMVDLAMAETDGFVSLKDIAERQKISAKYMEQIIALLKNARLVSSVRGPRGGYRLSKSASDYTVGEILRLTEGSLAPVACIDNDLFDCERCEGCATVELWRKLDTAISQVVDNMTLADLVEIQRKKRERV
ncbi:RrF2 family transcriptional regulator [Oscillospiraceae bacterium LTW-04]|nr:Rrf2 family transcriptional regulator [Oscillospiraceae bacterium MB24-C1]